MGRATDELWRAKVEEEEDQIDRREERRAWELGA
jgi:hypothetical protein